MSLIEGFVRPFVVPSILPPPLAPRPAPLDPTAIIVSLGGKGGTTVSMTFETTTRATVVPGKNFKETGRKSTLTHVENEDDPDQFVEFCRADKVSVKPKKRAGGSDRSSSFGSGDRDDTETYSFDYPKTKECKSPNEPPKGCGSSGD